MDIDMDRERVVCPCLDISIGDIEKAVQNGASSLEDVQEQTEAGTVCEACVEELEDVIKVLLEEK